MMSNSTSNIIEYHDNKYTKEYITIALSALFTGPITWPLASLLLHKQQGNHSFRFIESVRTLGWKSAFSGCGPYSSYKLFGIGTQRAVQVPVQSCILESHPRVNDISRFGISGLISGLVGGFLVTPVEQFKLSLATRGVNSYSEAKKVYLSSKKGVIALFSGARITIYRNMLFDSVNAVLYNSLLIARPITISIPLGSSANDSISWQFTLPAVNRSDPISMAVVNAVAGVITAAIDYPLDVLKTRIQADTCARMTSGVKTPNVLTVTKDIVMRYGVRGLYFGLREKIGLYFYVWAAYGAAYGTVSSFLNRP